LTRTIGAVFVPDEAVILKRDELLIVTRELGRDLFGKHLVRGIGVPPSHSMSLLAVPITENNSTDLGSLLGGGDLGRRYGVERVDLPRSNRRRKRRRSLAHLVATDVEINILNAAIRSKRKPPAGGYLDQQNPMVPEEAISIIRIVDQELYG